MVERGVAQLGQRAAERLAGRTAPAGSGASRSRVKQQRERPEAGERGAAAAVDRGRHQHRQAGVELAGSPWPGSRPARRARLSQSPIVTTVDARGLACPLPLTMAKRGMAALEPGETLVVLATDPEAPIDLGAWAAEEGHASPSAGTRAGASSSWSKAG